ncbi:hypothetical protein A7982_12380 [Minicystis rosea]|nr:hypothetical protein A7982_12380 [Minicystis rosea]
MAVASAEHVARGRAGGFMQVCHGKAAPLRRVSPGDWVAYYSPTASFQGRDRLQAFTAFGVVKAGEPHAFDMGGGFRPFRRDVEWLAARTAEIGPLIPYLDFSAGSRHWGYRLRAGLFAVSARDVETIARAMAVRWPASGLEASVARQQTM